MSTNPESSKPARIPCPTVDSERPAADIKGRLASFGATFASRLLGTVQPHQHFGMPSPLVFAPHENSRRYGATHFGVMIPDLPAPHSFMAFASLLGMTGMKITDAANIVSMDGPRHTAVLVHGTAAATNRALTAYSMKRDMTFAPDGSLVRFGEDAELSGRYPRFRLKTSRPGFDVDLNLSATGEWTWFVHSRLYQHIALLARYEGVVSWQGNSMPVSGLASWEYYRTISPYLLRNAPLPPRFRIPLDFFTYQIINLDSDTQLLLAYVTFMGRPAARLAHLRRAGRGATQIDGKISFTVLTVQDTPAVAPDASVMFLPRTFRWTITDRNGKQLFEINATVDTEMLYGLAAGYVGGYRWEGSYNGKPESGRGYIEYIDQRG
ncbi:DUF6670 family protein [Burkholderia singularis]|uniref:DUF6670 family protein n=1 Tax=Burkholderia singularis TaxID=1503053 RepID=UPI0011808322|nr:DUF6670 family protein [Burkholderia singularis]